MSKFFIKQAFAEAMDLQKNGRLSEAKEIYLKILVQSPNDANALHLISLVFMAEGNYDEAKSEAMPKFFRSEDLRAFKLHMRKQQSLQEYYKK